MARRLFLLAVLAAAAAVYTAAPAAGVPTTLDMSTAKAVANAFASDCGACEAAVTECSRLGPKRIDCVTAEAGSCDDVTSVKVAGKGYLYFAFYRCKAGMPPTAAAQVQAHPPGGLRYEPLTRAPFEDPGLYPKHLRYPPFPVRHYSGKTSQRFQRAGLWFGRNRVLLTGSGVDIAAPCFHGAQFVQLGGGRIVKGQVTVVKRHAAGGYPAFRFHGRVVAGGKRIGGSLQLLHLKCAKKQITFSTKLVGKPGF